MDPVGIGRTVTHFNHLAIGLELLQYGGDGGGIEAKHCDPTIMHFNARGCWRELIAGIDRAVALFSNGTTIASICTHRCVEEADVSAVSLNGVCGGVVGPNCIDYVHIYQLLFRCDSNTLYNAPHSRSCWVHQSDRRWTESAVLVIGLVHLS